MRSIVSGAGALALRLSLVCSFLGLGCMSLGRNDPPDNVLPPSGKADLVGPSGGTVRAHGASLSVPPGALDDDVTITISVASADVPADLEALGPVFEFGPAGLRFAVPAEVTLDAAGLGDDAEIFWSGDTGAGYGALETTRLGDAVTAPVEHLSRAFVGRRLCPSLARCGACRDGCPVGAACVDRRCECPVGQVPCAGTCVDLATSVLHCGTCDAPCPAAQACVDGACACPDGRALCGESCRALEGDPEHCGACDHRCPAAQSCVAGSCVCPGGHTLCGDGCVSLDTDPAHCGACGVACASDELCEAGICTPISSTPPPGESCDDPIELTGYASADFSLADRTADEPRAAPCSGSTAPAPDAVFAWTADSTGPATLTLSAPTEPVDVTIFLTSACDAYVLLDCASAEAGFALSHTFDAFEGHTYYVSISARDGVPAADTLHLGLYRCIPPLVSCGGACVDLASDPGHCGACGNACDPGTEVCSGAACTCSEGRIECGGTCVSPADDDENCGGCGIVCAGGSSCVGGACSCPAGLTWCDGACRDTSDDEQHCGGCGVTCEAEASCVDGVCVAGPAPGESCAHPILLPAVNPPAQPVDLSEMRADVPWTRFAAARGRRGFDRSPRPDVVFQWTSPVTGWASVYSDLDDAALAILERSVQVPLPYTLVTMIFEGTSCDADHALAVSRQDRDTTADALGPTAMFPVQVGRTYTFVVTINGETGLYKHLWKRVSWDPPVVEYHDVPAAGTFSIHYASGTPSCASGTTFCSGTYEWFDEYGVNTHPECVSLASSAAHCGACGHACNADELCSSGVCIPNPTPPPGTYCDGMSIDLEADRFNCGSCGNACASDRLCHGGVCVGGQTCEDAPEFAEWSSFETLILAGTPNRRHAWHVTPTTNGRLRIQAQESPRPGRTGFTDIILSVYGPSGCAGTPIKTVRGGAGCMDWCLAELRSPVLTAGETYYAVIEADHEDSPASLISYWMAYEDE